MGRIRLFRRRLIGSPIRLLNDNIRRPQTINYYYDREGMQIGAYQFISMPFYRYNKMISSGVLNFLSSVYRPVPVNYSILAALNEKYGKPSTSKYLEYRHFKDDRITQCLTRNKRCLNISQMTVSCKKH